MSKKRELCKFFEPVRLQRMYDEKVKLHTTVGLDRITQNVFEENLDNNLEVIFRKVKAGTYRFTRYREMLISKGKGKEPRVISIPTIRDKLVLAMLHKILQDSFYEEVNEPLLHSIIGSITKTIKEKDFDCFVKIDIKRFYASINHSILEEKVAAKIEDSSILHLVHNAITTETIPMNIPAPESSKSSVGIPEGLSISNILADIYLADLEKKIIEKYDDLAYFRYVDDILILCYESDAKEIKEYTISLLKNCYKLDNHEKKTICDKLSSKVPYLGYVFSDKKVSIRDEASNRIERVIEELFQLRKRNQISQQVFEWRLNIKIAGCIHEKKKYGWMFYYSQITDLEVLYHLDWYVGKLFARFGFSPPKDLKRFVHVYHEITKNLKKSTYLIKTENYDRTDKEKVIFNVLKIRYAEDVDEKVINDQFQKLMFREVKKLERDIQNFS